MLPVLRSLRRDRPGAGPSRLAQCLRRCPVARRRSPPAQSSSNRVKAAVGTQVRCAIARRSFAASWTSRGLARRLEHEGAVWGKRLEHALHVPRRYGTEGPRLACGESRIVVQHFVAPKQLCALFHRGELTEPAEQRGVARAFEHRGREGPCPETRELVEQGTGGQAGTPRIRIDVQAEQAVTACF